MIDLEEFKAYIKEQRSNTLITPYALAFNSFKDLKYDTCNEDYFAQNASYIVETLRAKNWSNFQILEKKFTEAMLKHLIEADGDIANLPGKTAAVHFAETYPNHIYELSLSNTQSRRSRAGKEFEAIIELILLGAGIQIDSQGKIGKTLFKNKGLGKLVDLVSPGVVEFTIDKNQTCLISAKTTLRERWQEVPEEMNRTGASKMYLATLDDSITKETLNNIYEQNIIIVTTQRIKQANYIQDNHVISFEKLIRNCKSLKEEWDNYQYSNEQYNLIREHLENQKNKSSDFNFVSYKYDEFLRQFQEKHREENN